MRCVCATRACPCAASVPACRTSIPAATASCRTRTPHAIVRTRFLNPSRAELYNQTDRRYSLVSTCNSRHFFSLPGVRTDSITLRRNSSNTVRWTQPPMLLTFLASPVLACRASAAPRRSVAARGAAVDAASPPLVVAEEQPACAVSACDEKARAPAPCGLAAPTRRSPQVRRALCTALLRLAAPFSLSSAHSCRTGAGAGGCEVEVHPPRPAGGQSLRRLPSSQVELERDKRKG